jgi:hypothetical protein
MEVSAMVSSVEAGQAVGESCGPDKKARKRRGLPLGVKPMLSAEDVAEVYDVSLRSIWRWVAAGKIPAPDLRLGSGRRRLPRWRQDSIITQ